jgi:RHS repeat-associated protein
MQGLSYQASNRPANLYLYNGKELQDQTGYYDYGFRQQDPQLGRWHLQYPLRKKS